MTDDVWTETVLKIFTKDEDHHYEAGPDPDDLGLELRYVELIPATMAHKTLARIGFSPQQGLVIGQAIIQASRDALAEEARRKGK